MQIEYTFQELLNSYKESKITLEEIITSNNKYPNNILYVNKNLTKLLDNLHGLCHVCNIIRNAYGNPLTVSSGLRTPEQNQLVGGATESNHTKGLACDFVDKEGQLDKWFLEHKDFLLRHRIAIEDPRYTKNWCHVQIVLPKSGKNIFIPYTGEINPRDRDFKFFD